MQYSSVDSEARSTRLLDESDGEAVAVTNSGAASPFLLLGDHAGRGIPAQLGDLGLSEPDLSRHIAWDIGVAGLGQRLSAALDATFIAQRYSRLVIDCNRDPARPDSMPVESDATPIPGNRDLSPADRALRVAEVFAPYHARIARELDARAARGLPTIVVALHSFTPVMQAFARPWRFGVLHLGDSAFSRAMLAALRAEPDAPAVGDNEPYRMDDVDFTIPHHAIGRGLDYVELEVRQDLLADDAGQDAVAERLARILPDARRRYLPPA
ncbi:MAG: N-formylglutamate amidohydrolase [Alphaproteobacteria bacterium]|nr:N-formylglutamate amidohydrolase [Alphaproteobacteria bacterium]MBU1515899.1 N-formylglutamate amidohydrolase [Alphaproteobacteria bacterium]MBU2094121.1 N-formylglutamate amidohydrolase [Alphaproteobacteria bacterium]MBU2151473.1 N-formylglutamate amidohydrolase [Alphaproteobacteria bacterium]MBU2305251.1 N-formylglutamate amidohydrolase [Alphaproteobacteria bacterium]